MAGGRAAEGQVATTATSSRSKTSKRCVVVGCPELHRNADGYCHNHRAKARAIATVASMQVRGGDALAISKSLGQAGMEALAPYIRDDARLRTLVLNGVGLETNGMQVLAEAMKLNTTVTALDVSGNKLGAGGAKAVEEMLQDVAKN